MQAAETCALAELLPDGLLGELVLGRYEFKRHWIAKEKKLARVKCQHFGELAQNLVRGMTLAGFEMANQQVVEERRWIVSGVAICEEWRSDEWD